MLSKPMFAIPAMLMTMLGICVCQKGCTPQPINAYFELTNTSANALTSTVTNAKEVATLLPNDTNLSIYVINGTSVYTYGPYHIPNAFKDFDQDLSKLHYLRVTTIEEHAEGVSDNNDDKGKANIDVIFGRTACESSVDSKRITYVVVTSNLNHCTDLASDDQHTIQMPLTGAYKEQFQAILCNDTHRLCDTDHFLQGQSCSPCQDVCVNLQVDTNLRFCKDVCKYYKLNHSSTAASRQPTSGQMDSKYIIVLVILVFFGVVLIGIIICLIKRKLERRKANSLMCCICLYQVKYPLQETTGTRISGVDIARGGQRETTSDDAEDGVIEGAEGNYQSSPLIDPDIIPDNPASNVKLLNITDHNDTIAGENMHDLRPAGRLSEP